MSEKPTCRTCKHWHDTVGQKRHENAPPGNWGECQVLGLRIISHFGIAAIGRMDDKMLAEQDSRRFWTPLDHGCIHHEPRP